MSRIDWEKAVGTVVNGFFVKDRKRENRKTWAYVTCPRCSQDKWMRTDVVIDKRTVSCGCYNKANNLIKPKNISKKKFGRLTAIKPTAKASPNGSIIWECLCECGNTAYVDAGELLGGRVASCGCLRRDTSREVVGAIFKKYNAANAVEGTRIDNITRKKLISSNTSGYTGVYWDKARSKWHSQIEFKGKNYYLGRYDKKEDAIKAREIAEKEIFGSFLEWYNDTYKNKEVQKNEENE